MFLQNFVLSCIKRMKNFTDESDERPPPSPKDTFVEKRSTISNADQEIVRESLEMGLPVIPFAQRSLFLPDKEEEERDPESHLRRLRRKSSDLKKELSDFRFLNKQVYFEEDEEENVTRNKDTTRLSSSLKVDNFRRKHSSVSSSSSSPYFDMSPGVNMQSNLQSYMQMDEFLGASQMNGSKRNYFNNSPHSSIWGENTESERSGGSLSRFFKKGNRHKADYVFVDFEKDNYVDMNRISNKKWKSLTHFQQNKNVDAKQQN